MIPFYYFRRAVKSPTASIFYSGLLENMDEWGREDRLRILSEIDAYAKRYAWDWMLTLVMFGALLTLLFYMLHVLIAWPFDEGGIFDLVLQTFILGLFARMGILHITDAYRKALDLERGAI